jgi:cytidylate kinase
MWKNIGMEHCLSFINLQLSPGGRRRSDKLIKPAITISRMAGAGGRTVAGRLAEYLQTTVPSHAAWTVFDRQLVGKVLEDHHLSKRVAEYMPENHRSLLTDMFEELLGLHPSDWTLVHQTAETILHLAEMGNVILVGRGANVITSKLLNTFHVRLVGSIEKRTEQVQKVYGYDRQKALDFIKREDKGRKRFLKEHFEEDVDNPVLYHLVINTDRIAHEDAARLIGDEVIRQFELNRRVLPDES